MPRHEQPEPPPSYQGKEFPTRGALVTHLAIELKTKRNLISTALYQHNWDIKAAVDDLKSRPPPEAISYFYQGQHFPSKSAVARHLQSRGVDYAHAVMALTGQTPGDVTNVIERYCEAFDLLIQPESIALAPATASRPTLPTGDFLVVGVNPHEAQTLEEYMRILLTEARWVESTCPYRIYRHEDGRLIWRALDIE